MQGQKQGSYIEYGEGLLDCKFSPDGLDIILLGEDGTLTSRTFDGLENHVATIEGAEEVLFSDSGTRMHVSVESDDFIGLITFDYSNFNELQRTNFFHIIEDVAFIDDEYSRIQTLFVSGGTGEVAVYLRDIVADGFNEPGSDLDGDSIPDNLDEDDDGDGIIDDWDDDIGCDAPEGTPCSRYPDLSKIRNIEITVGEYFVVRDQISLPSEDSSNIRNLSRNAIAKDQVLSSHETELFANAMCDNMDHSDIVDQWRDSISLSNGELGDASISCFVVDGMEMIRDGDSTTQITFAIVTTFEYDSAVNFPLQISLGEQPLPTDGSISWLAPAHPVALTFAGDDLVSQTIPLWWNNGDDMASVTMEEVVIKDPTVIESAIDWALHPIALILYLGILIGLGTLWLRHQNKIDFDIDDEDSADEDLETDEEDDEDESYEPEKSVKPNDTDSVIKERPKRTPPPSKRKMYSTSAENEPLAKRKRVSEAKLNKDGPIMKTKRKRLDSIEQSSELSNTSPIVAGKKKVVKSEEPVIKKRKVKTAKKEEPEPKPKKKRKSVRRKKKQGSEKKIDENKMQDDLVSDFLKDQ